VRLRYKSQSRNPSGDKGRREQDEWAATGPLSSPVLDSCLRRIFRWRVPPNWSVSDWRNEMRAEAACAAWQALCDYDPSFGVPFSAFAYQRVLTRTLTRHRQEWAYALRLAHEADPEDSDSSMLDSTTSAVFDDWPRNAQARLSKPDLWLIEQLFLGDRTETDIAKQIGITQQAVSKRKWIILLRLRRYMAGTLSQQRAVFSARIDSGSPRVTKLSLSDRGQNRPIKL
jgi:DNA-directed RNA polymerase specialized sigma24 family protein